MTEQELPESTETVPNEPGAVPPTDFAYADASHGPGDQRSKWPKVIGIITIIYASLGMTCQGTSILGLLLAPVWRAMIGINIEAPPVIQVLAYSSFAIYLCLGIYLFVGGVRLLRRRAEGVKSLKTWAVMRLVMVIVSFVAGYLTIPANVEMQRNISVSVNEILAESNQPPQPFDEAKVFKQAGIGAVVGAGLTSIYPIFLGFFLSRKKVDEEIETWADEADIL